MPTSSSKVLTVFGFTKQQQFALIKMAAYTNCFGDSYKDKIISDETTEGLLNNEFASLDAGIKWWVDITKKNWLRKTFHQELKSKDINPSIHFTRWSEDHFKLISSESNQFQSIFKTLGLLETINWPTQTISEVVLLASMEEHVRERIYFLKNFTGRLYYLTNPRGLFNIEDSLVDILTKWFGGGDDIKKAIKRVINRHLDHQTDDKNWLKDPEGLQQEILGELNMTEWPKGNGWYYKNPHVFDKAASQEGRPSLAGWPTVMDMVEYVLNQRKQEEPGTFTDIELCPAYCIPGKRVGGTADQIEAWYNTYGYKLAKGTPVVFVSQNSKRFHAIPFQYTDIQETLRRIEKTPNQLSQSIIMVGPGGDEMSLAAAIDGYAKIFYAKHQRILTTILSQEEAKDITNISALSKHLFLSLHEAAAQGDIDTVKQHIEYKADVNDMSHSVTSKGKIWDIDQAGEFGREMTPLHLASYHGHTDIVKSLIENVANINLHDSWNNQRGKTALEIAVTRGFFATAIMLVERGANIDSIDISKLYREGAIRHTMSAIKEKFHDYLCADNFGHCRNYFLSPEEQKTKQKFLNNYPFAWYTNFNEFYSALTDVLVEIQPKDIETLSKSEMTYTTRRLLGCYNSLNSAGFHNVNNRPINFWCGEKGEKKAREKSSLSYSDFDIPVIFALFYLCSLIREQESKMEKQYLTSQLDRMNTTVFASQAKEKVYVYIASDKLNEKPGLTVDNFFWNAELPILQKLYGENKIIGIFLVLLRKNNTWSHPYNINDEKEAKKILMYRRLAHPLDTHPERFKNKKMDVWSIDTESKEYKEWKKSEARPSITFSKVRKIFSIWQQKTTKHDIGGAHHNNRKCSRT